jgi:tRNA1(Val) A37 N6-methylase TrmN6
MELKILDDFKYLIKPLPKDQRDSLRDNIQKYGLREPLVVWKEKNILVDGHNRYEICAELNIIPPITYYSFADENEAKMFIIENQIIRRNLQPYEKIEVYLKVKDSLHKLGIAAKKEKGKQKKHNTLLILAEKTGYSHDTVHKALYIAANADEDSKNLLRDGKATINQIYSRLRDKTRGGLAEKFIVPPFSIIDTTTEDWRLRKNHWKSLMGDLGKTRTGEWGTISGSSGSNTNVLATINEGTSNFDPVIIEVMLKWYAGDSASIIDPFGGEQAKGFVCGKLGHAYCGIEIRQDQVDHNRQTMESAGLSDSVVYHCGDSRNILELVGDARFDMCITSPPYYNLEVYSKEDLSSLGTYEEFIEMYKDILVKTASLIKEGGFFVIKVGEIRKENGEYYGFVGDTIQILRATGLSFYNDLIIRNNVGTGAMRASNNMRTKKVVRLHQNLLVFYKGDPSNLKSSGNED